MDFYVKSVCKKGEEHDKKDRFCAQGVPSELRKLTSWLLGQLMVAGRHHSACLPSTMCKNLSFLLMRLSLANLARAWFADSSVQAVTSGRIWRSSQRPAGFLLCIMRAEFLSQPLAMRLQAVPSGLGWRARSCLGTSWCVTSCRCCLELKLRCVCAVLLVVRLCA